MRRTEPSLEPFRCFFFATLIAIVWTVAPPVGAQEGFDGLCALLLQQERLDLEDDELSVQAEQVRLDVAAEIFGLVDGLYQNDLFERLPYLGFRHRRDVAQIALAQAEQRAARQRAVLEQYGLACSSGADQGEGNEERPTIEAAHQRYIEADCALRLLEVTAFEVDLDYHREILASRQNLRQNDIASRQEVLFAEEDVRIDEQNLALARERAARCPQ